MKERPDISYNSKDPTISALPTDCGQHAELMVPPYPLHS
jgi:hypothetical protein